MMSRFVALLCLSVAGCSHDSRPVEPASESVGSNQPAPSGEPKLAPASFEGTSAQRSEASPPRAVDPSTPRSERSASERSAKPSEPVSTMSEPSSPPANSAREADAPQPDNTKVNERDRGSALPTPMDQGNDKEDLKLTQSIRQAIMADKSLSFTAKNVKIITKAGKVTLRGPVKTADERAAIEADARKAAGDAPIIDNQIEVKK